jgi:hypothetical protein
VRSRKKATLHGEPCEVFHCSKAAYLVALTLEQEGKEAGWWPEFPLCEVRIREALAAGETDRAAFLRKVLRVMKAREFLSWGALFVLDDADPDG